MLLSILELIIALGCILDKDQLHVTAANIMLGKPARQSSTLVLSRFDATNANDGNMESSACTKRQLVPFWQGDLQGSFAVDNITITKTKNEHISEAYIGVSSVAVNCPNDDVTWCGQWPAATPESTLTFNCSHEQPVRFVRVWRNISGMGSLVLVEVEVEGTPRNLSAATYNKSLNTKLDPNVTSVNAVSANDCAFKCLVTQPCPAFSYNPSVQIPCILATSTATTTATGWVTYSISTCSKNIACDQRDKFK